MSFSRRTNCPQSVLTCPELYNEMYAIAQEKARAAKHQAPTTHAPFSEVHTSVKWIPTIPSVGALEVCSRLSRRNFLGRRCSGLKGTFKIPVEQRRDAAVLKERP